MTWSQNKKGGAAQRQIKQIEAQNAHNKSADQKRKDAEKEARAKEKAAAEAAARETAELFKPVQTQKVPVGVDPKSVLCQFFKKGHCDKGKKCKFSHDLNIERKSEKRSLYDNGEAEKEEKEKDEMADWDEEKLRQVVMSKHGNPRTTTDKVCKFFIEAVENSKYGWFWTCPNDQNGKSCMYRHTLPPGFVLKTKEQRAAEKAAMANSPMHTLTLEDWLESERHKLTGTLTPVTPESFAKWKKDRLDKKAAEEEARQAKEATGKRLFEQGGFEASDDEGDDDDAWNMEAMRRETEALRARKEEERLLKSYGASEVPEVPIISNGEGSSGEAS